MPPEFDDYEPEDAWVPDDPPSLLILNLLRRAALLVTSDGINLERDLILLDDLVARVRLDRPLDRDQLRADDLEVDIAFVRERLKQ